MLLPRCLLQNTVFRHLLPALHLRAVVCYRCPGQAPACCRPLVVLLSRQACAPHWELKGDYAQVRRVSARLLCPQWRRRQWRPPCERA